MSATQSLQWMSIREVSALIRARDVSPVELVDETLAWLEVADEVTHAFAAVRAEAARVEARSAEREIRGGRYRGPLHGVPYSAKDLIAVKDVAMGGNSKLMDGFAPREDAAVVERMTKAGAICVGKVRTHEFGWGVYTRGSVNPWDGCSVPGGSSGGSGASVAAGQCAASIGTDCATSVRTPAALNGICGLRPTYGRISTRGAVALSITMDTVGPLARTAVDVAMMLQALAGHDPLDVSSATHPVADYSAAIDQPIEGLRIGIPTSFFNERLEEGVARNIDAAIVQLEQLGCELHEVTFPHIHRAESVIAAIIFPEGAALHDEHMRTRASEFGLDVRMFLSVGNMMLAKDYWRAQQIRTLLMGDFERAFEDVDVVLTPATPATAKPYAEDPLFINTSFSDGTVEDINVAYLRFTVPISLVGYPALIVPCGFSDGLPTAVQLVGRPFEEATILRVGHAYQGATNWHSQRPTYLVEAMSGGESSHGDS